MQGKISKKANNVAPFYLLSKQDYLVVQGNDLGKAGSYVKFVDIKIRMPL